MLSNTTFCFINMHIGYMFFSMLQVHHDHFSSAVDEKLVCGLWVVMLEFMCLSVLKDLCVCVCVCVCVCECLCEREGDRKPAFVRAAERVLV